MIGPFWNIRGLGKIGWIPTLVSRIRDTHADFVGIMETKKESFSPGFLRSLTGTVPFSWNFLPAIGSAGGILVGANADLYTVVVPDILCFSVSIMIMGKKSGFSWKLIVVYGSPYEEGKQAFWDELHYVLSIYIHQVI